MIQPAKILDVPATGRERLATFSSLMEGAKQKVFISCSAESKEVACRLDQFLADRGWSSAVGLETAANEGWQDAVAEAISGAEAVILLVDSQPSEALRFEWSLALRASWQEEGKKVVPVLLLGAEAPPFLRNLATVRLSDNVDEEGFEKILRLIGSEADVDPPVDDPDEQDRLAERLDQAIEILKRDSPSKAEVEEHRTALEESLDATPSPTRGLLLLSIGLLDAELGDHQSARSHLEGALQEVEAAEQADENRVITVLMPLGDAQSEVEDYEAAVSTFERVHGIQAERDPGSIGEAAALQKLGIALFEAGKPGEARGHLSRALSILTRSSRRAAPASGGARALAGDGRGRRRRLRGREGDL